MIKRLSPQSPLLFQCRRAAASVLPHCAALSICIFFALAGLLILDDYGVGADTQQQRRIGVNAISYALGLAGVDYPIGKDFTPTRPSDNYYGVAFETPLVLLERLLGLTDTRSIHLTRHLLTHLFFILGGFCCYLLAYRLCHNRRLALLALLLFFLHPRIYAHSFFNSKDLPFLSMFIITLYLLERAFRKDTAKAFILVGIAVGLLTNIRIIGALLFPAVLAMRGLDLATAASPAARKHLLTTGAVFALAAIVVLYATWPWLWSNPIGHFRDSLAAMAQFSTHTYVGLFQGEWTDARALPPDYLPVWFAITTPPLILLLGLAGAAAVLIKGIVWPAALFHNARLRFGFLLLACFILPPLAAVILQSTLYHGWRQLVFLYAPFCMLALLGFYWLTSTFSRQPRLCAATYGLTGLGLGLIALQMIQLHPNQHIYFNAFVDRNTPERLQSQYNMDDWAVGFRQGLEYLLQRHPGEIVHIRWAGTGPHWSTEILAAADRQRLVFNSPVVDPDYILRSRRVHWPYDYGLSLNRAYALPVYDNTVYRLAAAKSSLMDAATITAYQELYQAATAYPPIVESHYSVYLHDRTLFFIKENCPPGDLAKAFGIKVYRPATESRFAGWGNISRYRTLRDYGVRLGDKCLAFIPLPDYAAGDLLVGQYENNRILRPVWEELYNLGEPGWREALADWFAATPEPTIRAPFDLYRQGRVLLYYRETCAPADAAHRFFLHIDPANPADLPLERTRHGFDNRDFDFYYAHGIHFDGHCAAYINFLPDYPIAQIRTGQFTLDQGQLWAVEFPADE